MKRDLVIWAVLLSVAFLAMGCNVNGEQHTVPAPETPAAPKIPEIPEVPVDTWLMPSTASISSWPELSPSNRITVDMARGEAEHVQLVVKTPAVGTVEVVRHTTLSPASGVSMEVREVRSFDGVDDVLVPIPEGTVTETGLVKLWLTFETTAETRPGSFEEVIVVRGDAFEDEPVVAAVRVNVHDVTIPEIPSITALFGVYPDGIASGLSGEELLAKRREFSDVLLEYRITPYFWVHNDTRIMECLSSPYPFDDPRTVEYLNDARMKNVVLQNYNITAEEMSTLADAVKDKGRIYYASDEPTTLEQYEKINSVAAWIHENDPGGRVITPFYRGPKGDCSNFDDMLSVWDHLTGTSIFCTGIAALHNSEERSARSLAKCEGGEPGEEWWTYACGIDRPGLAFNSTNVENRAVMWRAYKERSGGFLYWSSNFFVSLRPLRLTTEFPRGDGAVLYPGEAFGCDKPVASVRLERWRDGAEDYELMKLMEARLSRDAVLELLGSVYASPAAADITSDPERVEAFHAKLLEQTESL